MQNNFIVLIAKNCVPLVHKAGTSTLTERKDQAIVLLLLETPLRTCNGKYFHDLYRVPAVRSRFDLNAPVDLD